MDVDNAYYNCYLWPLHYPARALRGLSRAVEKSKIITDLRNEPFLQGLQTVRWPKLGSYGKNQIFGPKIEISGPKKAHILQDTMFWLRPQKSWSKKKVPFSKINISLLKNFGMFFWDKMHYWPKKTLFGWTWKRPFLRWHSGSFFDGPDGRNGKVVAPGILVIWAVDKNSNYYTINWLLAPNIQIFG